MNVKKSIRILYLFFSFVIILITVNIYFNSHNGWILDGRELAIPFGVILLFLLNIIFSIVSYFNKDKVVFIISIIVIALAAVLVIFPICRYLYEKRYTAYVQANAIQIQGLEKINFTDDSFHM
ncbi:MAG: hypothetical protein ACM3KR_10265 [Deltaproteobacteria bacterium]